MSFLAPEPRTHHRVVSAGTGGGWRPGQAPATAPRELAAVCTCLAPPQKVRVGALTRRPCFAGRQSCAAHHRVAAVCAVPLLFRSGSGPPRNAWHHVVLCVVGAASFLHRAAACRCTACDARPTDGGNENVREGPGPAQTERRRGCAGTGAWRRARAHRAGCLSRGRSHTGATPV